MKRRKGADTTKRTGHVKLVKLPKKTRLKPAHAKHKKEPLPKIPTKHRILVINPGSTSTKIALYKNEAESRASTVSYTYGELRQYRSVMDQEDFRLDSLRHFMKANRIDSKSLDAVVGRGGLLKPIEGGIYRVNDAMLADLRSARFGEHASNLGAVLAWTIAREAGCPAFIVDPVVVDELDEPARVTGIPEIRRRSLFHALNQKSAAREVAARLKKPYEKCAFIVAHLGGGISVGAHKKGRVADVNNALDGDGPIAPERAGSLPAGQLAEMCFSGKYSFEEVKNRLTGRGGLVAHRGSNSLEDLKKAASSRDDQARLLYDAMALRISQEICKHSATLEGKVDRIILTGGMARDEDFVARIKKRVRHVAPVVVIPGEREMLALARGALSVLTRKQRAKEYR
jgi:butyrate kinase